MTDLTTLESQYDGAIPEAERALAAHGGDLRQMMHTRATIALAGANAELTVWVKKASEATDARYKEMLLDSALDARRRRNWWEAELAKWEPGHE